MSELKTKATKASAKDFIAEISDAEKRKDSEVLLKLLKKVTGQKPVLWNHGAIGFGNVEYKGKSGRSGIWYLVGFSPRKQNISLHLWGGWQQHKAGLKKLGKFKLGAGCMYVNKLADIDVKVLEKILDFHWKNRNTGK